MNKLSVFLLSALMLFSIGICTVEASDPLVSSAPLVTVFDNDPIDSIVKKPSEEDMCAAKMQWIEGVPHNKLEKVYMSAVFDESMFKKLKDKDNLAFEITSLIDREFAASGMTITPYSEIARKAKSDEELQSMLNEYDSGITIVVEKQDDGEVIMRGYLETPADQLTYANYAARSLYGKKGSYDAKVLAFSKALRGFVNEINDYKAGEIAF